MDVHRHVIVGVASLAALYAGASHALGLGEMRLESALHQPLSAIIEVHGAEGLAPTDIVVTLADAATFARVGVERPYFLSDLRFTPVVVNSQLAVRVESSRPVNEPYLNFLVQLHRPSGLLLREYTVLLDPPMYRPAPVLAGSARTPAAAEPVTSRVASAPRPASAPAPELPDLAPQPGANRYRTTAGDSLWTVAQATRLNESISVARQMRAIRALNPEAFVNGDMDKLRADRELILPTAGQMGVDAAPARVAEAAPPPTRAAREVNPSTGGLAADGADDLTRAQLRIEEPALESAVADNAEVHSRLAALESRFSTMLAELEARDQLIASLEAELEILRGAQQAALAEPMAAPDAAPAADETAATEPPVAGAIDWQSPAAEGVALEEPVAATPSLFERGWMVLLALLAAIAALILYRRRQEPRSEQPDSPRPLPVAPTQPGTRAADPLEGVELYLTYGRFAEARILLDKAIKAEPQRLDLRFEQLGVLAALGDAPAFAEQAQAVLQLGGDPARVAQLKARLPQADRELASNTVEPVRAPTTDFGTADTTDLDMDFDLNADWQLIDGLGAKMARAEMTDRDFQSNLTDFPEVGELDEGFSEHFQQAGRKPGNER